MANQTLANILAVVRDEWDDDKMHKQFYDDYPILDRLEKVGAGAGGRYMIGNKLRIPIWSGRSGSTTTLGPAGGSLNAVSAQKVAEADYTIAYNWDQVGIEFGALNQASGGASSVIAALDLEIQGKINDQRKDITGQFLRNGDGLIARCTTNSSGQAVVLLDPATAGYGAWATTRALLRADQTVDIGTTANPTAIVSAGVIQSVTPSTTAPAITLTANLGSGTTTSHFVSITGARSGSTTVESTGLRAIFGSSTAVVGGIDPATNPYWAPGQRVVPVQPGRARARDGQLQDGDLDELG
jgi:hypothetical protein